MKQGYKVIDMDTHVGPTFEILERYVEPSFRPRLQELEQYKRVLRTGSDGNSMTLLSFAPIPFDRIAGQAPAGEDMSPVAGGRLPLEGRVAGFGGLRQGHHRVPPRPGTQNDNADGRIADMDDEGRDVDFMFASPWVAGVMSLGDPSMAEGLYRAYHRHMGEFTSKYPDRLKSHALIPATDIEWGVTELRSIANEKWLAGVWVQMTEDKPIDHPDFDPLWETMNDLDLPLVHHSFFTDYPYFPGYRDMWGNAAISRCAAHPWGAARLLSYLICSGLFDRFPNLRCGVAEVGHGWLPQWVIRLGEMLDYVKGTTPDLKHAPIDYVQSGRFLCGAEPMEGPKMTKACIDILGEDTFAYQSDYPHGESYFPDTAQMMIDWPIWGDFSDQVIPKFMSGNAEKFLRMI